MYLKTDKEFSEIDNIRNIFDELHSQKKISVNNLSIPNLNKIINSFEKYDFLILPHGGQNHSTFEKTIPEKE